jgi:subtilisin family serine protease
MIRTRKAMAILITLLLVTSMFSGTVGAKPTSSKNPKQTVNEAESTGEEAAYEVEPPGEGVPQYGEDTSQYAKGEIIVKFKPDVSEEEINKVNAKHKTSMHRKSHYKGLMTVKVPKGKTVEEMVKIYNSDPNVEYAEPNYIYHLLMTPNDPDFSCQWGMNNVGQTGGTPDADIDAPEAWDVETGDPNVVIAIIDTGVVYTHPEFDDKMWVNEDEIPCNGIDDDGNGYIDDYRGWDYLGYHQYWEELGEEDWWEDNDPMDDYLPAHGTHCAGIAAAETSNGIGVAGVFPNCKIMPLKVFTPDAGGYTFHIAQAIRYATDQGAKVISMSLGGDGDETMRSACQYAHEAGLTIVCAAGTSNGPVLYPAAYDEYCLAVAATDHNDDRT